MLAALLALLLTAPAGETAVLDRIDALDRLISQLSLRQHELKQRLTKQEARHRAINDNVTLLQEQLSSRRTLVQQRLRARGRLDEAAYVRVLLTAHDPTELVLRQAWLRRVLHNDARLLRDLAQARDTLARLEAEQKTLVADIEADRGALEKQREALEAERRNRTSALAALRREGDALRKLAAQREQAGASLPLEIGAAPVTDGFAVEKGRLPRPTAGRVVRGYGKHEDPELGTSIFLKGQEIDALMGAPVRAVFAGRVAHAGWYRGFGNLVILAHGGGYHTLYGHLSSISRAVGDTVAAGDPIGEVGDTGSLRGPMLYFEIREQKKSLDPAEWLVKR